MKPTPQLLQHFKSTWLCGVMPMIVEHRPGALDHICPSPSLWMGGRFVAHALQSAGIGPGDVVVFSGTSAISWTQTLVGCMRLGATMVCGLPSAFRDARAALDDQLILRAVRPEPNVSELSFDQTSAMSRSLPVWEGDSARVGSVEGDCPPLCFLVAPVKAMRRRPFGLEMTRSLVRGAEIHVLHERRAYPIGA
jgi:hypothetical protein